jgi:hypothetical protein
VPAGLAQSRVTEGDVVLLASHSAGLPLKVQENVPISVSSEDFLSAETDTFSGSSGGPLYDSELNVVAIAGSGAADWESMGGCTRSAHTDNGNERQIWIEPAWAALCDSGWPSVRLCGSEPRCGDGICSPSEGSDSCARDCAAALCGDGLCELAERATCEPDCHAFDAVPAEALDPVRYLARRRTDSVYSAKGGCGLARHGSADSREGRCSSGEPPRLTRLPTQAPSNREADRLRCADAEFDSARGTRFASGRSVVPERGVKKGWR